MTPRVALVTSERGLRVDPDLRLAGSALQAAGLTVDRVRWDDPAVNWDHYDLAVVRSCWDYAWRLEEFLAWAASVPRLRNPVEVLRWNTDKTYLRDLERRGLPVVPTVWDPATAGELPNAGEWVVKPSISAGSRDTARWSEPQDALAHAGRLVTAPNRHGAALPRQRGRGRGDRDAVPRRALLPRGAQGTAARSG